MNFKPAVLFLSCALLAGCGGAAIDDKAEVAVTYELKIDGKVAEKQNTPVAYNINTYPTKGLYEALKGKKSGDSLKILIPPEKGYGMPKKELVYEIPMDMPTPPKIGDAIRARSANGTMQPGVVMALTSKSMTIDFNHPYAGKTLEYDLKVRKVAPYKPK